MIRGSVPSAAKKLVRAFGERVFDIIEAEPERLREVTGIGRKRAEGIVVGWAEQLSFREIMIFLYANGVDLPLNFHPAAIRGSAGFALLPIVGPPET